MDIIEGMRREFSMAKRYWLVLILAQILATLAALYVVFNPTRRLLLAVGGAGLLIPLITFYLKEAAGTRYSLGERLRRLLVIQDGLGRVPLAKELVDISADCTSLPTLEPKPLGNYYDSPLPPGPNRLAHIVEESAAYTRKVASVASAFYGALTILGLIITFLIIWIGLESISFAAESNTSGDWVSVGQLARVLTILLPFFVTGTFAALWRAYRSLSESARKAFEKCDQLRQIPDVEIIDVMVMVGSYDCALAKAPPLPGLIYWLARARIGRAWTAYMSKLVQ
jgi:hypothetical protein